MLLFAPAHSGALISELVKELDRFAWLKFFWRSASPLIDEVAPGSDSINDLRLQTVQAIQDGGASYLITKKVIIAEIERVVSPLRFGQAPVPVAFVGTNHRTVCKPRPNFTLPVDQVEQLL